MNYSDLRQGEIKSNRSDQNNQYTYYCTFDYLKSSDLREFLDTYDKQDKLFSKKDYHAQNTSNFYIMLKEEEQNNKNKQQNQCSFNLVDLSKSGFGERQNSRRPVMLVEFSDWIECIKKYDIYYNNQELFKKCEHLHRLLQDNPTLVTIADHWEIINTYIHSELYYYLHLYVLFTKYLFNIQTMLLQRHTYNFNSSPTLMIPFSSELNTLVSYDRYIKEDSSEELVPYAVLIKDNINDISNEEKASIVAQPIVLKDNYKRLGDYFRYRDPDNNSAIESFRGIIYNYIYKHESIEDSLWQITLPYAWKYLYNSTVEKTDYHKAAPTRDYIMKFVFQQYAFVGFSDIAGKANLYTRLGKSAFLLNNPFLTDKPKMASTSGHINS